jgi:glycerophosphoryl diester phosphodiesterase
MKIFATVILILSGIQMQAQQMIIAHRGASNLAPENTLASVKLAWELGADAVEIDVHLSKDNRVMVIHDKDTKRTCSGKTNLEIAKCPSLLLRDLDAGVWKGEGFKGEKIPFLEEIIETVPVGKTLIVEIKSGKEILPHIERILEKYGTGKNIVFIDFDWKTILAAKERFPDCKCYWLSESKSLVKKRIPEIYKSGLNGINISNKITDQEIMDLVKTNKVEVLTWTIDDPVEAKRLITLGVTAITTNRPKWLREEITK